MKINQESKQKLKKNKLQDDMPLSIKIIAYICTTFLSITCILPLLICLSSSFTSEEALGRYGYQLIPKEISFEAYDYIFRNGAQIWQSYGVTLVITIAGVLLGLFVMSMFSYAVTRPAFPWKNQFGFFVYFTMLFSGGMVASYIVNTTMYHLRDTVWILILTGSVGAYNILLMRTYFRTSIPPEVIESAEIDGAGSFRCYFQFALPMAVPMLATIALFMTVGYWNNWNTAMLYIVERNDLVPIQLFLKRIENNINFLAEAEQNMSSMDLEEARKSVPAESFRMALTMMVALPMLVSYPFFQKYFINGITVGAVKG